MSEQTKLMLLSACGLVMLVVLVAIGPGACTLTDTQSAPQRATPL